MPIGTVHLVGAGPGDTGLVTLRAKQLIETCDALVYDYLISDELLTWVKLDCQKFCVGKKAGFHSLPQEEIETLLVRLATEGKTVVRLKGGDPFVFGRGGEEIQRLKTHNIPYTIVPGITAALGAAAAAEIPLTHRDFSSSLIFVTGHEDPNKTHVTVDWRALAQKDSTLCLYMSMGRLEYIATELMAGGLPATTPACVVQWGTTAKQKILKSTLGNLYADVQTAHLSSPAIVYIGNVTELAHA